MITNPWHYDRIDKVLLIASMVKVAQEVDDLLIIGDYGNIEDVATIAAQQLPGFCYEGARWDGCIWIEILEDTSETSLAHWLTALAAEDAYTTTQLEGKVGELLERWLTENERTLRNHAMDEDL